MLLDLGQQGGAPGTPYLLSIGHGLGSLVFRGGARGGAGSSHAPPGGGGGQRIRVLQLLDLLLQPGECARGDHPAGHFWSPARPGASRRAFLTRLFPNDPARWSPSHSRQGNGGK